MIELNKKILYTTTIVLFSILFFSPLISYSEKIDDLWNIPRMQQMLDNEQHLKSNYRVSSESSFNSESNFVFGIVHYQVRDNDDGLICMVQSDNLSIHDSSKLTFDYLSSHPSHSTFENNGQTIYHVVLKDSWNVGEGDTFLSALRTTMYDPEEAQIIYNFFGTTNGCAIQPGDRVTVIWEIIYN